MRERNTPNVRAVIAGVAIAAGLMWLDLRLPGRAAGTLGAPASDLLQIVRSGWVAFAVGLLVFVGAPLWGRARMTDAGVLALLVTMMSLAVAWETAAPAPGFAQLVPGGWGVLSLSLVIAGAALGTALRAAWRLRRLRMSERVA